MIIIHYQTETLFIYQSIAKRLKLTHGQRLTSETEFWNVVQQNAAHYALLGQYHLEQSMN